MAFVRVEAWEAPCGLSWPEARAPLMDQRSSLKLRRGSAVAVSLAVHALLIWVFVARLAAGLDLADEEAKPGGAIKLLELSSAAPEAPAVAAQAPATTAAVAPQPEVDTTVTTEVPPPEWTVSRIRLSPPFTVSSQPATAAAGAAGVGASGAGNGTFDPYAGAAPVRLQPGQPSPAGAGGDAGPQLDRALLDAIRYSVSRSLRSGHGTVLLAVRISSDGVVIEGAVKSGTASPEAKARFRQALLRRRLFAPTAGTRTVDLPLVELSRQGNPK